MIVKGLFFGLVPAAICCFEALRLDRLSAGETSSVTAARNGFGARHLAAPIVRAACLSMMSILLLNMTWFMLVYHAVPVYGPSLLQPPTP
jgi:phospholipid/cholesterol/gamma-HCH transport system permease protein